MDRPVSAQRKVLYDSQGNRYVAEHAGAWDPPADDLERIGCYYEDEYRPEGAVSLYRLTKVRDGGTTLRDAAFRSGWKAAMNQQNPPQSAS